MPEIRQREQLLQYFLKNVRTAVDLDVDEISRTAYGMSPADIANLVQTAGRNAIKYDRVGLTQEDLVEANDKIHMGVGHRSKMKKFSEETKWNVSWHEAGHALVNYLANKTLARTTYLGEEPALRVHKVTIIPRGNSGGHTAWLGRDGNMYDDENWAHLLAVYGGYIGEEFCMEHLAKENNETYKGITTGPSGDFGSATRTLHKLVEQHPSIKGVHDNGNFHEAYDKLMLEISNKAYNEAKQLLHKNKDKL